MVPPAPPSKKAVIIVWNRVKQNDLGALLYQGTRTHEGIDRNRSHPKAFPFEGKVACAERCLKKKESKIAQAE